MEIRWYHRTNSHNRDSSLPEVCPSFSCLGLDPKSYCTRCFRKCGSSKGAIEIDERKIFLGIRDTVGRQLLDLCNSEVKKGVKTKGF